MGFFKTVATKLGLSKEEVIDRPLFLSPDEIVKDLISKMNKEAIQSWLDVKYEDLIRGHMFTGMSIRNTYHLWHEDNPYTLDKHPDDISFEIMQSVWKEVQQKYGNDQTN